MRTETKMNVQTLAVMETICNEKGDQIPKQTYPVTIQFTEKPAKKSKLAADVEISNITLITGNGVPDGRYYTLVFEHQGKERRYPNLRVNDGLLLSQD
jgi:hypothetical protein